MPEHVIGLKEVRHMAELSRLSVPAAEEELFARQFGAILDYMDVLNSVDVGGVEPLYSPVEHETVLREDVAGLRRTHEEVLSNAPESDGACFVVPRIV